MDKGTTNSGIPVFGEIIKLLDKQEINNIAVQKKANRYTKRLDAHGPSYAFVEACVGKETSSPYKKCPCL